MTTTPKSGKRRILEAASSRVIRIHKMSRDFLLMRSKLEEAWIEWVDDHIYDLYKETKNESLVGCRATLAWTQKAH